MGLTVKSRDTKLSASTAPYALINKWDWRHHQQVTVAFTAPTADACRDHYHTLQPASQRQLLLVYRPGFRGGTLHELEL